MPAYPAGAVVCRWKMLCSCLNLFLFVGSYMCTELYIYNIHVDRTYVYIYIIQLYTDACIYIYTHDMLPFTGNLQEWVLQRNIWEIVGNEPIWMPDQGLPIFSHRLASGFWSSSSLVEPLIMKYGINLGWAEILNVPLCFFNVFFTMAVAIFVERISCRLAKFDRDNPSRCADALPFANVNVDFFYPGILCSRGYLNCNQQSLYVFPSGCHWSKLLCRTLLLFLLQSTHNIQMSLFTRVHFILLSKYALACGTIVCRCSFDWKTSIFHTQCHSGLFDNSVLPNLMLNHPLPSQFDAESSPPCQNGHQWAVYPMLSIHIQRSCCWIPCGEVTSINIVIILYYSYWPCQFIKGYIPMIFLLINYIPSWYRRIHAWCAWNAPGAKWLFFAGVGSIVLSAGMGSSGSWNGGTSGHFSSHILNRMFPETKALES